MDKEKQLELIETKIKSMRDEIDELKKIYETKSVDEYRRFNNVFLQTVNTLQFMFSRLNFKVSYGNVVGTNTDVKLHNKVVEVNCSIKIFVNDMLDKFNEKSKNIVDKTIDSEGNKYKTLDRKSSEDYKYTQQIINDYTKLLMEMD